jgi:predicted secreted protein
MICLLIVFIPSFALPPEILWNRLYGGVEDLLTGRIVLQTPDNGFIIAGEHDPLDGGTNPDFLLIKTDPLGVEEWRREFGLNDVDFLHDAELTTDGGYILLGDTDPPGTGGSLIWVVKTNSQGIEEWNQTYDCGEDSDHGNGIELTDDGGYIICATNDSNGGCLIKIDSLGSEEWQRFTNSQSAWDILQTEDGGYAIVGDDIDIETQSSDAILIKTNADGVEEWRHSYGGDEDDYIYSLQQTYDDGYIIAGKTESFGSGSDDYWLIKTDSTGAEEWNQVYGGENRDICSYAEQTIDGGYVMTGITKSFGNSLGDIWVVRTDSLGVERWNIVLGGNSIEKSYSMLQTSDGGYAIVGESHSFDDYPEAIWVIKLASDEPNLPPSQFNLLSPENELVIAPDNPNITFRWERSIDPNLGDQVLYDIQINIEIDVHGHNFFEYHLSDTTITVSVVGDLLGDEFGDEWNSPIYGYWYVTAISADDTTLCNDIFSFQIEPNVGVDENSQTAIPTNYEILSVYPNPFNPTLNVSISMPETANLTLSVYNIMGQSVATVADRSYSAGTHNFIFNANEVTNLGSGVYFIRAFVPEKLNQIQKVVLLK